jgi:nitrite reductase (NADH) large subunit
MSRYVIIGSGIAGVTAAETIRRLDPDGTITIYNGEPFPFYFRAAMAFYIKGMISEDDLYGKPSHWAKDHRIRILGEKAVQVHPFEREVVGQNGIVELYDKLLIATGSWPFVSPWPGKDLDGVMTYRSLMCARKTVDYIKKYKVKSAAIIGGGILGVEFAENFQNLGIKTTIIAIEERLMELLFDKEASSLIEEQMRADGVELKLGAVTEGLSGKDGRVDGVILKDDVKVDADLVGVAIGVLPHVEFLENSGLEIDSRGLVVDERLRTSDEAIWGAGDVSVRKIGENYFPCRTWLTAAEQGRQAGVNMTGTGEPFVEKVFFNASHVYKSLYAVIGSFKAPEEPPFEHVKLNTPEGEYAKLILENGKLVGAMFVGGVAPVWDVFNAIAEGRDVDIDKVSGWRGHRLSRALNGAPPTLF